MAQDYMAGIDQTVNGYADIMKRAKDNADKGLDGAQNFTVPLVGWKIGKGPFKDEKQIAAYKDMQDIIKDMQELLRKAREAVATGSSGTNA